MVKGVAENEQARHRAVGFASQLVANLLHAFRRTQIDIEHDPGEIAGGRFGNVRRRDGINLAHRFQDVGQLAAVVAAIGRQQQPALGRSRVV